MYFLIASIYEETLKNLDMMCLSSLLTPFFCSISDASLFFLPNTHLSLSFVRPQARFVPVVERMVVPAFFCFSFLRDHVDPKVTLLLYCSEAKDTVSVDTASLLTVFLSPIAGWYLYFCSILLSQWRFGPASWCGEMASALATFLFVSILAHAISKSPQVSLFASFPSLPLHLSTWLM